MEEVLGGCTVCLASAASSSSLASWALPGPWPLALGQDQPAKLFVKRIKIWSHSHLRQRQIIFSHCHKEQIS